MTSGSGRVVFSGEREGGPAGSIGSGARGRWGLGRLAAGTTRVVASEDPDSEFRLARLLYYLGMGFVAAGALRPIGGLVVSDWFFFASFAIAAGTVVLRRTRIDPSFSGIFVFGFAVFSVGALFSLPVALHPLDSMAYFARFTYTVLVWFALGAVVLRNRRQLVIAIAAWILSVAISGLAAIAQVTWGPLVFASFTSIPLGEVAAGFAGRRVGLSLHPNDLGATSAIALAPAILFAASGTSTATRRYASIGLLGLVMAGVALSGSVTAFGAALASVAIWLVSGRATAKRLFAVAGTLTVASIALVLINQRGVSSVLSPIDRLSLTLGLTTTPEATGLARLNLDSLAWNEIARNPLYGVGLDTNSIATALGGISVHNMFLLVWVGAGAFGALGLLIMVIWLIGTYLIEYQRSPLPMERALVLALGTSFVSFLIVTLAQPILFVRYGWVPAALLFPVRAIRLRAARAQRPTALANGDLGFYGGKAETLINQIPR